MTTTTTTISLTGWNSISDCLLNNRCWICEETFQKDGDNNTNDTNDTKNNDDKISNSFIFNNMKNCYNSYLSMPSLDSQEKGKILEKELLKKDIALWMSGLVCCTTEECMKHYTMIIPNTVNSDLSNNNDIMNTSNNNKGNKSKKSSIFTFANRDDCGPNCKCDSPWKFELPGDRTTTNTTNTTDLPSNENETSTEV